MDRTTNRGSAVYHARDLMEKGEDFVVAEVVDSQGSSPRKKGAWLLMDRRGDRWGTVGGGRLEAETEKRCPAVLESGVSETVTFRLTEAEQGGIDMRCGGDVTVHFSVVTPAEVPAFLKSVGVGERALIFGGGHVGLAVERVLRFVGFDTVVLDDRPEYAGRDRFPDASELRVISDYDHAFDGLSTDGDTYVVIVTRGHAGDYQVLREALKRERAYVGMIGSRKKVAAAMENLRREGVSEEELKTVHSPIGLKIGAETPEEIAVSIAGELIAVRAQRRQAE